MWNENVCRLCLSNKELFCVFEKRENQVNNLKQIIFITAGVEILKNDVVSQKICQNCYKVTVKMFDFRNASIKTDHYLKEQYASHLKRTQPIISIASNEKKNPITSTSKLQKTEITKRRSIKKNDIPNRKTNIRNIKAVHTSITSIFSAYPNLKIPTNVLSYDINPLVSMELDAVENYYVRNKLDMNKAVQNVLRSTRPPKKKCDSNKINDKKISPISNVISNVEIGSSKHLKRKIDVVDAKSDKSPKISVTETDSRPPTLLDTLKLKPKDDIHLCQICGSIHGTSVMLDEHIEQHFRCNLCKMKFKLVELKDNHENTCVVKHILNCNVYVPLYRINLDTEDEKNSSVGMDQVKDQSTSHDLLCTETIELSDGEDPKYLDSNTNTVTVNESSSLVTLNDVQYCNNTSLVRPDVKIKDGINYFNDVDKSTSDTELLKRLLTKDFSDIKKWKDAETQIEFSVNKKIIKHPKVIAARFKSLKSQLFSFKIPIYIQKGDFSVNYTKTVPKRPVTNNRLWSDLPPIGLKKTSMLENNKPTNLIKMISSNIPREPDNGILNGIKCNSSASTSISQQQTYIANSAQIITANNCGSKQQNVLSTLVPNFDTKLNNLLKDNCATGKDNIGTSIGDTDGLSQLEVFIEPTNKPSASTPDNILNPVIRVKKLCELK